MALYFIGENDYHRIYYESIIDSFLGAIKPDDSSKKQEKGLAGLYLASQMIAHYASEANRCKISILVTEYLIILHSAPKIKSKFVSCIIAIFLVCQPGNCNNAIFFRSAPFPPYIGIRRLERLKLM